MLEASSKLEAQKVLEQALLNQCRSLRASEASFQGLVDTHRSIIKGLAYIEA